MKTTVRTLFGLLFALFFALTACASEQVGQGPETVLTTFYPWYLGRLNDGVAPIASDRANLAKYVSQRRMSVLAKEYAKGALDVDYFTKAQDVMDDWQAHVSVTDVAIKDQGASAIVTLGNVDKWRLKVFLTNAKGRWRIDKVVAPQPK
ncbi:Protein of unknown function [Andreprevotia lacus DSM 23236]|jgi:hypothetical protein|uniref:DUF3828 domain-containing protein n=1 Tax=Andreprevotia lacus DSM 23236 TaxID=1121001 RepID=A0A1W1XCK8_9NEIS|nr:DUF3828 domain-containing protein [Andreprevotia lacus]SMC21251.1 Protein of unknown function [Andreprevotia lacus DSM 23236]